MSQPQQPRPRPKTRVQRMHMAITLNWYEEQLSSQFDQVILSESQREVMRRHFAVLQSNMRQREKTNSWQIPLEINFNDFDGTYRVGIIDESNVLYLD